MLQDDPKNIPDLPTAQPPYRFERAYRWIARPTLIVSISFCLPVAGNLFGVFLANALQCTTSADSFLNCPVFGHAISDAANAYIVSAFFAGLFNFAIYFKLLTDILPTWFVVIWMALTLYLAIGRRRHRKVARRRNSGGMR